MIYVLLVLLAVSVVLNVVQLSTDDRTVISDTTRVTVVDTIPYRQPVPVDSVVVKFITKRLPVKHDTVQICRVDSVDVEMPITQKRYADSTYTAWISGYNPALDSIHVYSRKEVVTITKTIKPRRWSIGVQGGYGMTPKGWQPYVGVGVTYKISF